MATITRVSAGRIGLLFDDEQERDACVHAGYAWSCAPERGVCDYETRLWLLPYVRKHCERLRAPAAVRAALASLRQHAPTPECPDTLTLPLRDYQRVGASFLAARAGAVLADDTGLGKTWQCAAALLHVLGTNGCALVTTTTSTAWQWHEELERLWPDGGPALRVIDGTRIRRAARYAEWTTTGGVLILNHALLRRDVNALARATTSLGARARALIVDEASAIRNRTTKLWAACARLGALVAFRWALTATPIENRLSDVAGIVEWARPGYLQPGAAWRQLHVIERSYRTCRRCGHVRRVSATNTLTPHDCRPSKGHWRFVAYTQVTGHRELPAARAALSPVYLRRTTDQVDEELPALLPPVWHELDMTPPQARLYASIKNAVRTRGWSRLTVLAYLRLIANDPATYDPTWRGKAPKVELIKTLVDQHAHHKVVICTESRRLAIRLHGAIDTRHRPVLLHGGTDAQTREHVRARFQDDTAVRAIVMTSAGERGLNLQSGGVIVHADMPWNPAKIRQRIGRVRRIGSSHNTVANVMTIMRGTVEERVVSVIGGKVALFDAVLRSGADTTGDLIRTSVHTLIGD